jgi:hypothetical protein
VLRETEPGGKVEDDVGIGTSLAWRRRDRRTQLDQELRLGADLEAHLERLALEARRDGQHDIGQLRCGIHEQVGMGVKFQCLERLAPSSAIGVRQQHIGAEADGGAHRMRFLFANGAVEIAGGVIAPARRPERPFRETQGWGHALCRRQLLAGRQRGRRRCEHYVAAGFIEIASEGVEQ